jgi:DNA-binding beta-propeller fold protein YncE
MKIRNPWITCAIAVAALSCAAETAAKSVKAITLTAIGRYSPGGGIERAEIAAYDAASKRIFAINPTLRRIEVLDVSNPAAPELDSTIALLGRPNSVAISNGMVAVAVENSPKTSPGWVQFFDVSGNSLNTVTVGSLPDMLVFTPNGRRLLVANEGEPNSYGQTDSVDPEGSVSIIDMTVGAANLTAADVRTARFTDAVPKKNAESIRIYGPGATLAQDLEPEYITVSHDSKTAWVTLQENNAIAILDIEEGKFTALAGLGFKDHSLPRNRLDASDSEISSSPRRGTNNVANWPVFGMYLPDGIASYRVGNQTFLVTANEGDTREWPGFNEELRVGAAGYVLDPVVFPNADTLKLEPNLGRLVATRALGAKELDADDQFERIFIPGARSFSIRTASGELIYDSGEDFEKIIESRALAIFNSDGTAASFDTRSDNKGPEPEGVVIAKVFGRTYAFIGLERAGGIMIYDISDPFAPFFVDYVNTSSLDLSPEGLLFIKAEDSPNGKPLLVVSHEISSTTTIFEIIKADPEQAPGRKNSRVASRDRSGR